MASEREEKHFTLLFVRKGEGKVLLGQRKRGHVNMRGKWNGFGGKVEAGESILDAAAREVKEECGLFVEKSKIKPVGKFTAERQGNTLLWVIHIFETYHYKGQEHF